MSQSPKPKWHIYPSLMDSYTNYLQSAEIYDKYWGGSECPPQNYEEFEQSQWQDLIDKINRVSKDLPKADVGTVFNELVDCMVLGRKSDSIEVEKINRIVNGSEEVGWLKAHYKERTFTYPIEMCREFANYYKEGGAIPQMFVEGFIQTDRGIVRLYGYADEVMSGSVHDIKTSGSYEAFKYKSNAQHLVYPYCLRYMGIEITDFCYDLAHIKTNIRSGEPTPTDIHIEHIGTYQEEYSYNPKRDVPIIQERLCQLIDFIEAHRHLITNTKLFGEG